MIKLDARRVRGEDLAGQLVEATPGGSRRQLAEKATTEPLSARRALDVHRGFADPCVVRRRVAVGEDRSPGDDFAVRFGDQEWPFALDAVREVRGVVVPRLKGGLPVLDSLVVDGRDRRRVTRLRGSHHDVQCSGSARLGHRYGLLYAGLRRHEDRALARRVGLLAVLLGVESQRLLVLGYPQWH